MFRKMVCILWALTTVAVLRLPVSAREGSIRIVPTCGGIVVTDGEVILHRVGEAEEGGFRLTDGLADWTIWETEWNDESVQQWLLQQERTGGDLQRISDQDGAYYGELPSGVYLVTQGKNASGYFPFQPFLVTIPEQGRWDLEKHPLVLRNAPIPDTSDRPAPIVGAMGIGLAVTILMVLVDKRKQ